MDWNDFRYLLAIERTGSIAAAAKQLGVTKSTASRRLAALEKALGARLVDRGPRGLSLTDAGREALEAARGMDDALALLPARIAGASETKAVGVVKLTAPPWLAERCLIPALATLKRQYPELEVDLLGTNQILNLAQREADLAIRNIAPQQKSLLMRKIGEIGGCVYASTLYLERKGTPTSRADVAGHDVLVYESLGGMPGFEWIREPRTGGRVAFRANDPVALVGAASAGLGLTAVPCLLGDAEPSLRRVEALGFSRCDLLLVTAEAVRTSVRVRVVSDFIVERIKGHHAELVGDRAA